MTQSRQLQTESQEAPKPGVFPATRWSVILDAGGEDPSALAEFCRAYWFPLYSHARRAGKTLQDAQDLTQSFFERILTREFLAHARADRGRLRNFLLRSFNNFMAEEWRHGTAQKRGSGQPLLAIDALSAEERIALEPHDGTTPELEYERAWARELLRQAIDRLGAAYEKDGKGPVFHALRDHLTDGSAESRHREVAARLGLSEAAARFAAFTLRQRYRSILRNLIADTVANIDEVEAEISHMRGLFQC